MPCGTLLGVTHQKAATHPAVQWGALLVSIGVEALVGAGRLGPDLREEAAFGFRVAEGCVLQV